MKQYSFAFTTLDSLHDEIEKVKINPENPQAPVIHVFTSTRSCDMVEEIMDCLKKHFPAVSLQVCQHPVFPGTEKSAATCQ